MEAVYPQAGQLANGAIRAVERWHVRCSGRGVLPRVRLLSVMLLSSDNFFSGGATHSYTNRIYTIWDGGITDIISPHTFILCISHIRQFKDRL